MAAIADIVINDGQATPVAHTFAPAKTQADYALLEDRAVGTYIGFNKLTFALTRPNGTPSVANRNLKLSIKVETPKLEVVGNSSTGITPPPTVSYRPVAELVLTIPERASKQDRKDLRAYMTNLLANAFVIDAIDNYELPY